MVVLLGKMPTGGATDRIGRVAKRWFWPLEGWLIYCIDGTAMFCVQDYCLSPILRIKWICSICDLWQRRLLGVDGEIDCVPLSGVLCRCLISIKFEKLLQWKIGWECINCNSCCETHIFSSANRFVQSPLESEINVCWKLTITYNGFHLHHQREKKNCSTSTSLPQEATTIAWISRNSCYFSGSYAVPAWLAPDNGRELFDQRMSAPFYLETHLCISWTQSLQIRPKLSVINLQTLAPEAGCLYGSEVF